MTLVLPHLAFPTTSSLHVDTGIPLARLAARRAAVLFVVLLEAESNPPSLEGEAALRGTVCRECRGTKRDRVPNETALPPSIAPF